MIRYRTRLLLVMVAAFLSSMLAGCGESPQVTVYKQGEYQGKTDTQPWASTEFKGDKLAWEKAVKARTAGQDEYVRIAN